MSYDCEECGGDLTGMGGPPCACTKVVKPKREKEMTKGKSVTLDPMQNYELITWLKNLAGEENKLVDKQEDVAVQATEALGFQVNKGHVCKVCRQHKIESKRVVKNGGLALAAKVQVLEGDMLTLQSDMQRMREEYGRICLVLKKNGIDVGA